MDEQIKNLPEKFIERVKLIVLKEKQNEVFTAFCSQRPSTFRANTLKISADELENKLAEINIHCKRVSWYSDAFITHDTDAQILMQTDLYKQGYLYIQNLSSMIPALVLDPQPDETILDIAAAPGSKTTQLAMMMKNKGQIIANDISAARMFKL